MKVFPNNKPCFRARLKTRAEAFKSGDRAAYKKAKYDVQRAIRGAKINYRQKLEDQFLTGDARAVWQGLQSISSYKRKSSTAPDDDPRLADKLNSFYARFGRHNTTCVTASPPGDAAFPPPFIVEECEVRRLFRKKNIRKAAGPDGVSFSTPKN